MVVLSVIFAEKSLGPLGVKILDFVFYPQTLKNSPFRAQVANFGKKTFLDTCNHRII